MGLLPIAGPRVRIGCEREVIGLQASGPDRLGFPEAGLEVGEALLGGRAGPGSSRGESAPQACQSARDHLFRQREAPPRARCFYDLKKAGRSQMLTNVAP